ncbi:MAG: hypothetical protein ACI8WT_004395 [Clostridium sp.]
MIENYELNTDLLDVTIDIAVAVFFSTYVYDIKTNDYRVKENGVGYIKIYISIMVGPGIEYFRMIGL